MISFLESFFLVIGCVSEGSLETTRSQYKQLVFIQRRQTTGKKALKVVQPQRQMY